MLESDNINIIIQIVIEVLEEESKTRWWPLAKELSPIIKRFLGLWASDGKQAMQEAASAQVVSS